MRQQFLNLFTLAHALALLGFEFLYADGRILAIPAVMIQTRAHRRPQQYELFIRLASR
jgi:hypothetical protein